MQTFLPYADFSATAACLDMKRLGKQRVEVLQILKALHDPDYGWQNHPAVKMWRGHTGALVDYGLAVCAEWIGRGYNDTCYGKIEVFDNMTFDRPDWLDDPRVQQSHRANLVRKDPEHYGALWPDVQPQEGYWWPV
jgi:hypothetical protein